MEDPLKDEAEEAVIREELKASEEAVLFMASVEPAELQRCVFADSLVTVSEGGRALGNFTVTVEFARKDQQPCMLLHAQSQGTIDHCPCGTTVTAYLTTDLEVLEEHYHEYVKLKDNSVEKKWHMVQRGDQLLINKVTTVGEDLKTERVSYPLSALRGLVTEGCSLLLLRLIALRKSAPRQMTFLSLDQELRLVHSTVVRHDTGLILYAFFALFGIFRSLLHCISAQHVLGLKQLDVCGDRVEVFGVERTVETADSPTKWQSYFLADGHLAGRGQVGSPVIMRLSHLPLQRGKGLQKNHLCMRDMLLCSHSLTWTEMTQHSPDPNQDAALPALRSLPNFPGWEEDMQFSSNFLDRKEELKADHTSYLRQHPEIRALISDFLQFLLLRKPDDVFQFAREYFLVFASDDSPA
ncbi:ciliogenesis-associated TTC17-interacting protein isoform X1 [Takifugu flavidus]|uniref:ciliogenesis-associated TTC17-interacting protein isoform X1 n=1 Tax=Takifugu flavidus TaxID=433684 RepID=UPI0025447D85|nr:ciliogenesis-associated TTC17-interacting protein isoform X1 [Takifugu flavidus]